MIIFKKLTNIFNKNTQNTNNNANAEKPQAQTNTKLLGKDVINSKPLAALEKDVFELKNRNAQFDRTVENIDKKITNQMHIISEDDISSIIDIAHKRTGVEKEKLLEILARLTQFSSYAQFNNLSSSLREQNIGKPIGSDMAFRQIGRYDGGYTLSLNKVLQYLGLHKQQFSFADETNANSIFVDNMMLSQLEQNKNNPTCQKILEKIKEQIKEDKITLVILDGWNAKVDDKEVSHTFLGSRIGLCNALTRVAKHLDEGGGLTLDEILNLETINKTKAIFGEDVDIKIIQNKEALMNPTPKGIAETLAPNKPDKNKIQSVIGKTIIENTDDEKEEKEAAELLDSYFEKMLSCYSSESLTQELKSKHNDIAIFAKQQNKTEDDIYYIVPERTPKSFDLVTYQYFKTNNIDSSKIMYPKNIDKMDDCDNKVYVILDDFVGSGNSIVDTGFSYGSFIGNLENKKGVSDVNVVFAPIQLHKKGLDKINESIEENHRQGKDIIIANDISDFKELYENLEEDKQDLLERLLQTMGYEETGASASMSYMIPDNTTELAGLLLDDTLTNTSANKAIP